MLERHSMVCAIADARAGRVRGPRRVDALDSRLYLAPRAPGIGATFPREEDLMARKKGAKKGAKKGGRKTTKRKSSKKR
jgi:hypothetical protein